MEKTPSFVWLEKKTRKNHGHEVRVVHPRGFAKTFLCVCKLKKRQWLHKLPLRVSSNQARGKVFLFGCRSFVSILVLLHWVHVHFEIQFESLGHECHYPNNNPSQSSSCAEFDINLLCVSFTGFHFLAKAFCGTDGHLVLFGCGLLLCHVILSATGLS